MKSVLVIVIWIFAAIAALAFIQAINGGIRESELQTESVDEARKFGRECREKNGVFHVDNNGGIGLWDLNCQWDENDE